MRYYLLILMGIFFSSCTNFENKNTYNIRVGETFQIYYSTGSATYFVIENKEKLKNIKLVEHKQLDNFNSKCDGCDSHYSFKFIGLSKGEETIAITENVMSLEDARTKKKYKVIVE